MTMDFKPVGSLPLPRCGRGRILLSSGEVSGDIIGGGLARALKTADPAVELWGLGGRCMAAAGVNMVHETTHLGTVGIPESLVTVPGVLQTFSRIRAHIRAACPHVAVLIGHEAFHIFLGRWLRAHHIVSISYFPPQVWLWGRIARQITKSFDWIFTSFADEQEVYLEAGARAVFVGHYLRDQLTEVSPEGRKAERRKAGLKPDAATVGLLPGSRIHEVRELAPILLGTARQMVSRDSSLQFVLPVAEPGLRRRIERMVQGQGLGERVQIEHDSRTAMAASDLLIACSGTATLEAALMGIPMVIVYRTSGTNYANAKLLQRAGLINMTCGLPNLLAGSSIVPELHQSQVTPSILSEQARSILKDPLRQAEIKTALRGVASQLGQRGGTERVAHKVLEKLAEVLSSKTARS